LRGEQSISGILERDVEARITQNAAIELFKKRCRPQDGGFDFEAIETFHFGIAQESGHGHPAPETNNQRASG
jgi:hypothetical protein